MSRKRSTRVQERSALSYQSVVDFVPGHEPHEFATDVELTPTDGGTRVVTTVEPLHDDVWTQRLLDGRGNEPDDLARVVAG